MRTHFSKAQRKTLQIAFQEAAEQLVRTLAREGYSKVPTMLGIAAELHDDAMTWEGVDTDPKLKFANEIGRIIAELKYDYCLDYEGEEARPYLCKRIEEIK